MNPIYDIHQSSILSQPVEVSDFLTFLEEIKELLEGLNEVVSDVKNSYTLLPGMPSRFNHQVKILMNFEKACLEMETLWQEMKGDSKPLQPLNTARKSMPKTELSPFPASSVKGEKQGGGRCLVLADLSEKKAKEIFLAPRVFSQSTPETDSASSVRLPEKMGSELSIRLPEKISPELSPGFQRKEINPSTRPSFFPGPSAQSMVVDKLPMAQFWQKIKPLLDHLIVVVETQENMSKPSEKLVKLVRSFIRSHASFMNLDVPSLLKTPLAAKMLEPVNVSVQQKSSSEKIPQPSSLKSKMAEPSLSNLSSPSSQEKTFEPILPQSVPSPHIPGEPKQPQPFAAPYTAEKKIEERKGPQKKKRKKFWQRKDQEEEKNLS